MQRSALATCMLIVLTFMLSGCGLHLRGQQQPQAADAQQVLSIEGGNRNGELASEVRRQAQGYGLQVTNDAGWRIRLDNVAQSQWLASSNPGYSRNEYWLSLSLELVIMHKQQTYQPVTLQRQLLFKDDTDALNSKAHEKQMIIGDLQRQLAAEILQLVSRMINNPPDCDCDNDES